MGALGGPNRSAEPRLSAVIQEKRSHLFGLPALDQLLPCPACRLIELLGRWNVTHVLQVANMGKNAIATAQNNANLQQSCNLAL